MKILVSVTGERGCNKYEFQAFHHHLLTAMHPSIVVTKKKNGPPFKLSSVDVLFQCLQGFIILNCHSHSFDFLSWYIHFEFLYSLICAIFRRKSFPLHNDIGWIFFQCSSWHMSTVIGSIWHRFFPEFNISIIYCILSWLMSSFRATSVEFRFSLILFVHH